ncbi:MAG: dihydroorotate dehydrogenase electron transfer subunit, partial [Tannerellaceae bacterium]
MKKYMLDMKVTANCRLHKNYCLLKLTSDKVLPDMLPGQFVEVRVDNSPTTFLRRPISVNYVDKVTNELWLLIQLIGDGTRRMAEYQPGDLVNIMLPLGNGFTLPNLENTSPKLLLVGGGVGTAPMLYLGASLKAIGFEPTFLLGARSKEDVLQLEQFQQIGNVYVTTEDGSLGEKGYVTNHSILMAVHF